MVISSFWVRLGGYRWYFGFPRWLLVLFWGGWWFFGSYIWFLVVVRISMCIQVPTCLLSRDYATGRRLRKEDRERDSLPRPTPLDATVRHRGTTRPCDARAPEESLVEVFSMSLPNPPADGFRRFSTVSKDLSNYP